MQLTLLCVLLISLAAPALLLPFVPTTPAAPTSAAFSSAALVANAMPLVAHESHVGSSATQSCENGGGLRLQLSVRSHMNASGHRVVTARVRGAAGRQMAMDVTQEVHQGRQGARDQETLEAVASVLPEYVVQELNTERDALQSMLPTEVPYVTSEPISSTMSTPPITTQPTKSTSKRENEEEEGQSPEEMEPGQGTKRGAIPDGDFEEVRFADYRPLDGVPGLYKAYRSAVTWSAARAACEKDGAHLLVPETTAEALAATKAFLKAPPPIGAQRNDLFFVGLSDEAIEGHLVTVTGRNLSSLAFGQWHPKEPSRGRSQNGVALDSNSNLHDIPNDWLLAFFCEAPAQQ